MPRLDIDTRREQLTTAAVRIALRDGLDNTTVRRVAQEAGVSLGTVHYCFDSKAALLEAVVGYLFAREFSPQQVTFNPDVPPVEGVRQAFRAYWEASGANQDFQRLTYELVTYLIRQEEPGPELARRIFTSNYELVSAFFDGFERTYSRRLVVPRETLARTMIALTDGVALAWLADQDEAKALEVLDLFADLVVSGSVEA